MIFKNIDQRQVYWIGLNDIKREKNFQWIDGQKAGFRYWARGEPNDYRNAEDCTCMNWHKNQNGRWNDFYCTQRYRFICKKMVGNAVQKEKLQKQLDEQYKTEYEKPKFEYSHSKNKLAWGFAQQECFYWGGALASIHSEFEYAAVLKNLPAGNTYWIGYNAIKDEKNWVWNDNSA